MVSSRGTRRCTHTTQSSWRHPASGGFSIGVRQSCAMSGKAALLIQTIVFHLSIRPESRNYQHRPSHIPQWPRIASGVQDRQNRRPIENKELCGIHTYSYQKVPLKVLIIPPFIDFMVVVLIVRFRASAGSTAPVQCQQSVTCDPDSGDGELQVWEAALTEAGARHPV